MISRARRGGPVLPVMAALALAAGGFWAWQRARTSTEVSVDAAVNAFRRTPETVGAVRGVPPTGVYTFRATGTERAHIGPVHVDRPIPGEVRYVVTHTPHGFTGELRISGQHTEAMRYMVDARGVRAVWRRVDVTFLGVGRDDRHPLTPAVTVLPAAPRVGASWPVDTTVWKLRITGRARIVREQHLRVGDASVRTLLVESRTRTAGAHGGPRLERLWWAPGLGMPVRMETDTTLGGVAGYRSRLRLDLASTVPSR